MKKKISIALCAVVLSISIAGCGQKGSIHSNIEASQTNSGINSVSESSNVANNDYVISSPSAFSDGYAWIQVNSNSGGITNKLFIDKSGNVHDEIYKLSTSFSRESSSDTWHDGTVRTDKLIVNSAGEIIFQTDDEYTTILTYGGGYYAIAKRVHDLQTDKVLICFMDTDGNWFDTNYDLNLEEIGSNDLIYLGEQIFGIGDTYINLKTKKATQIKDYPCGGIQGEFSDGVAVWKHGWSGSDALIYSNGTVKEIDINDGEIKGKLSDGGFVYLQNEDETTTIYFYDIETGKSKEITSYKDGIKITNDNLYFENGTLFFKLLGVDDDYYITFFDKSGKELIEPKSYKYIGERSCNRVIAENDDVITIYDERGNVVLETDEYQIGSGVDEPIYSDDYIPVYVKKYKENNYLDKDGNLLFPQDLLTENLHKLAL